ncbi:MAG: lysophospholipase [Spirochaetaceae bacterium]|nr:lysophospholipase [Spirochaetaceae bacterium]
MMEIKKLVLDDGYVMYYRKWKCEGVQKAILHINHGMAEHSARYNDFASYLNKKGITVYAQDHMGHGMSGKDGLLGYFGKKDGWNRVVDQAIALSSYIVEDNGDTPLFLFGHSMGSFIVRCIIEKDSSMYDGAIIMGTAASSGIAGKIGKYIALKSIKKNGPEFIDKKLNKLSFGYYNKKFDKYGSSFQWLSRDAKSVAKYEDDPLCGFVCTNSFYRDLIEGIEEANNAEYIAKISKDLSLLFISGTDDPVGSYSKGVQKVYQLYKNAGIEDLSLKLVEDARHELLNETNKIETYEYLLNWIQKRI